MECLKTCLRPVVRCKRKLSKNYDHSKTVLGLCHVAYDIQPGIFFKLKVEYKHFLNFGFDVTSDMKHAGS